MTPWPREVVQVDASATSISWGGVEKVSRDARHSVVTNGWHVAGFADGDHMTSIHHFRVVRLAASKASKAMQEGLLLKSDKVEDSVEKRNEWLRSAIVALKGQGGAMTHLAWSDLARFHWL